MNTEKILFINENDLPKLQAFAKGEGIAIGVKPSEDELFKMVLKVAQEAGVSIKEIVKTNRERQRKRSRYYCGSDWIYQENVNFIRGYPTYKAFVENSGVEQESEPNLGITGKGQVSRPTENEALKAAEIELSQKKINLIDQALKAIPKEYQSGVFDHLVYKAPYSAKPYFLAHENTWKSWTQKFVYEVAVLRGQKHLIDLLKYLSM